MMGVLCSSEWLLDYSCRICFPLASTIDNLRSQEWLFHMSSTICTLSCALFVGATWSVPCGFTGGGGSIIDINMMTSWNGNIFRVTGHLCGDFRTKASDAELWCFFNMRLNKRLSDLTRYRAHYDVIVMITRCLSRAKRTKASIYVRILIMQLLLYLLSVCCFAKKESEHWQELADEPIAKSNYFISLQKNTDITN